MPSERPCPAAGLGVALDASLCQLHIISSFKHGCRHQSASGNVERAWVCSDTVGQIQRVTLRHRYTCSASTGFPASDTGHCMCTRCHWVQ